MDQAFFWCYPWDLEDEGIEASLARMAGEIGVTAVSVAATCRDIDQLRARRIGERRTVRFEAAAHFQPDRARYPKRGITPATASWVKSRNPLAKIAKEAQRQGIKLRAWAVCCHSGTMVARYPMASCVDIFGDPIGTWLCPGNPDVREYLAALVEDLTTNYPLDAIELEAADFGHGTGEPSARECGVQLGPVARTLLSWCFCSSCRQRASIASVDVEAVIASAKAHIEAAFRLEPAPHETFDAILADDPDLRAYFELRRESVTTLIRDIRPRNGVRLLLHVGPDIHISGAAVADLREHCAGFIKSASDYGTPQWQGHLNHIVDQSGSAAAVDVGLPCYPALMPSSDALVAAAHQASQSGHRAIGFHHYGLAPEPCLEWVRQAVRYARREPV